MGEYSKLLDDLTSEDLAEILQSMPRRGIGRSPFYFTSSSPFLFIRYPHSGMKGEFYEFLQQRLLRGDSEEEAIEAFLRKLKRRRYSHDEASRLIRKWLESLEDF